MAISTGKATKSRKKTIFSNWLFESWLLLIVFPCRFDPYNVGFTGQRVYVGCNKRSALHRIASHHTCGAMPVGYCALRWLGNDSFTVLTVRRVPPSITTYGPAFLRQLS